MSRFFKSAAFPILIVIVLAFFAQKLIGSSAMAPNYKFGNLLSQLDSARSTQLSLDQKANSADVTLTRTVRNTPSATRTPTRRR